TSAPVRGLEPGDGGWSVTTPSHEVRAPVLGWQPGAAGFFWAAGLGGFGVQTSAGVGAYVAACVAPEAADGSALAGDPDFAALVNPRV
ncbi:MAG: hypothetical protein ACK53I_05525, partial [Phenylobacterium sp.]